MSDQYDEPPPRFEATYKRSHHLAQLVVVLAIIATLIALPIVTDKAAWKDTRFVLIFILLLAIWATAIFGRVRDRSPQLTIDTDGVNLRRWHLGSVPYELIDFVAMSRPGMRSALQGLLHNRRGAYIIVRFNEMPPFQPTVRPPFSHLQRFYVELDNREPVISAQGLDTSISAVMAALQEHIGYWRAENPEKIICKETLD